MSLLQLIYISNAVRDISDQDITEILVSSRTHNPQKGLTGVLVYKDGVFVQVLEGQEKDIRHLMAKIGKDGRHANVTILCEQAIEERSFPDWAMAYTTNLPSSLADQFAHPGVRSVQEIFDALSQDNSWIASFLENCFRDLK